MSREYLAHKKAKANTLEANTEWDQRSAEPLLFTFFQVPFSNQFNFSLQGKSISNGMLNVHVCLPIIEIDFSLSLHILSVYTYFLQGLHNFKIFVYK